MGKVELKDYIFYGIFDLENSKEKNSIQYGVKRKKGYHSHEDYFTFFVGIEPNLFYNASISSDWNESLGNMAAAGSIMFANSATEVEDLEHRLYLLYLPSDLKEFQLNDLERYLEQLKGIHFEVGVYGIVHNEFIKERVKKDFDSYTFVQKYLKEQRKQIDERKTLEQKLEKTIQQYEQGVDHTVKGIRKLSKDTKKLRQDIEKLYEKYGIPEEDYEKPKTK